MNPAVLSASSSTYPVIFLESFMIWFMFAGLLIVWYIDGPIKKEQVAHALAAVLLTWVIAQMVKELLPTLRPFQINGDMFYTISKYPGDGSFPSIHSAIAFAIAVTVWMHDRKLGPFFVLAAFLVGFGRVLSNVHYPVDVVGGAMLGSLVAIGFDRIHLHKLIASKR